MRSTPSLILAGALAIAAAGAAQAQVIQRSTAVSNSGAGATAIAVPGGGGTPLGVGIAPGILNQSNWCPADSWTVGLGTYGIGFGFGRSHVNQDPKTLCPALEAALQSEKLGVMDQQLGLHDYALKMSWLKMAILCHQPDIRSVAPPGVCVAPQPAPAVSQAQPAQAAPRTIAYPYAEVVAAEGPSITASWLPIGAGQYEWLDRAGRLHTAQYQWDGQQWRWSQN
jgi:hypothetical protein